MVLAKLSSIHQLLIIVFLFHVDLVNAFTQPSASTPLSYYSTRNPSTLWMPRHSVCHSKSKLNDVAEDTDNASSANSINNLSKNDSAEMTTVGSSEYYKGFITRSVDEEPSERVTGDAVLGPTLKLGAGISLILVALTAAFLVSNGII